ncbi:ATP-binding cassette domain-containing protein [Microvirga sp. M2]|uniref:ATP-binding cassette domain-containing protein n=1 Tax=Microvirga sp. M2 TaxID=3073270 RepID=UPI0039C1B622
MTACLRQVRGNERAMTAHEPMTSLNPVFRIGERIVAPLLQHRKARNRAEARELEPMLMVQLPSPKRRVDAYLHHLSGGMRQRVMIAMALAREPVLLIAGLPRACDATVQAQSFDLLHDLKKAMTSIVLITDDMGTIAEMAGTVAMAHAERQRTACWLMEEGGGA